MSGDKEHMDTVVLPSGALFARLGYQTVVEGGIHLGALSDVLVPVSGEFSICP